MPQPKSNRSKQGKAKASGAASKRSGAKAGGTKRSPRSGAAKPKSTNGRERRPSSRSASSPQSPAAPAAQSASDVRGTLARGAQASLSLVTLTRERIQDVVDDAVERGRMTRHDAEDLVSELVRRGRSLPPADRVLREADRARRTVGVGTSFPVLGYDDLTAGQVGDRLDALTPPELRKVRDYERRHANRKSVLGAIEKALEK